MAIVNNKILWISDFDLDQAPGGAQRSDRLLIDQGKILGHNILKVNFQTLADHCDFEEFDLIISSNLHRIYVTYPNIISRIASHPYHVRIEHDSNAYLPQEDRAKLFGSCKKSFFLSEYHLNFFKELYGEIFTNTEIVADPIGPQFKNEGREREDVTLYVGYMHEQKGTDAFFREAIKNPEANFAVAGFSSSQIYTILAQELPNVKNLGLVNYQDMPQIYNKYRYMFYDPIVREPFCRSVAEAILCGMEIKTNAQSKIGCIQEYKRLGHDKFVEECVNAPKKFWNKI